MDVQPDASWLLLAAEQMLSQVLALGEQARSLPVSSQKSFFGHAQGAAGILELIATLEAIATGARQPRARQAR